MCHTGVHLNWCLRNELYAHVCVCQDKCICFPNSDYVGDLSLWSRCPLFLNYANACAYAWRVKLPDCSYFKLTKHVYNLIHITYTSSTTYNHIHITYSSPLVPADSGVGASLREILTAGGLEFPSSANSYIDIYSCILYNRICICVSIYAWKFSLLGVIVWILQSRLHRTQRPLLGYTQLHAFKAWVHTSIFIWYV